METDKEVKGGFCGALYPGHCSSLQAKTLREPIRAQYPPLFSLLVAEEPD